MLVLTLERQGPVGIPLAILAPIAPSRGGGQLATACLLAQQVEGGAQWVFDEESRKKPGKGGIIKNNNNLLTYCVYSLAHFCFTPVYAHTREWWRNWSIGWDWHGGRRLPRLFLVAAYARREPGGGLRRRPFVF
jgi:hypothetical protein